MYITDHRSRSVHIAYIHIAYCILQVPTAYCILHTRDPRNGTGTYVFDCKCQIAETFASPLFILLYSICVKNNRCLKYSAIEIMQYSVLCSTLHSIGLRSEYRYTSYDPRFEGFSAHTQNVFSWLRHLVSWIPATLTV